jgi:glycosyltransferase involved in cell wall biosynthesis
MHPAKLNEYLVFGLPVVATATEELQKLVVEWPDVGLYVAQDTASFARAAARALEKHSGGKGDWQRVTNTQRWTERSSRFLDLVRIKRSGKNGSAHV